MTELGLSAHARSVLVYVVTDRSRHVHKRQPGARSDKEVLEERGGEGEEGGEGQEPDPFVETASALQAAV